MLVITIAVLVVCSDDTLSRLEGVFLFAGLIGYTVMNYAFAKKGTAETVEIPDDLDETGVRLIRFKEMFTVAICCAAIAVVYFMKGDPQSGYIGAGLLVAAVLAFAAQEAWKLRSGSRTLMILLVVAGIYGVVEGASVVVDAAERVMRELGIGQKFIGLTVVAFGTSLPELATSVVAALRKEMDISIGNLVGSNVFNLLGVLGVASMLRPIEIEGGFVGSGMAIDGLVMLGTSALPLLFLLRTPTIRRWQGGVLLCCYAGFLAYLIATI
jgi:Ca2+/Na+ antiporter